MTHANNRKDLLRLELLGIGSSKHRAYKANLQQALRELDAPLPVQEVQDIDELLGYQISAIPALLYNGKVLFEGEVPSVEDIKIVLRLLLHEQKNTGSFPARPIREILVSTDFSETAAQAYACARLLAEKFNARLQLVHVHQPHLDLSNPYQFEANGYAEKEQLLAEFGHPGRPGPTGEVWENREILTGSPVEELCRYVQKNGCDLVVMGTTGAGNLMGRWFGSISSEVARRSSCPVLLVPEGSSDCGFRNIVYAAGHSPAEEKVMPQVVDFARQFAATLHVAHVRPPQSKATAGRSPKVYEEVAAEAGVPFSLANIETEDVLQGLNWYTREKKADLMIMATTHRGFIEELFHRSMTRKMLFNTRIPLLILHY